MHMKPLSLPQNYINAAGFSRRLLELPDMNSERNAESRSKVPPTLLLYTNISMKYPISIIKLFTAISYYTSLRFDYFLSSYHTTIYIHSANTV